ncbi:MAG: hypothetical protein AABX38_05330 [Candidatus Micrarchaeota archaeon]
MKTKLLFLFGILFVLFGVVNATIGITVNSPANNARFSQGPYSFTFVATNTNFQTFSCATMLAGRSPTGSSYGNFRINNNNAQSGATTTNSVPSLNEGYYSWWISCSNPDGSEVTNSTNYDLTIDRTEPSITLVSPTDSLTLTNPNTNFNFIPSDNIDNSLYCSLWIDGIQKAVNTQTLSNTQATLSPPSIANGQHSWHVECFDDAGNGGRSRTNTFVMNSPPAQIPMILTILEPVREYNTTTRNVGVYFRMNGPSSTTCSVFTNGVNTNTGTASNNIPVTIGLGLTNQGRYSYYVECADAQNNRARSETQFINYDSTAPVISLISPNNGASILTGTTSFTMTASDNVYTVFSCSLKIDGAVVSTFDVSNNTLKDIRYSIVNARSSSWHVTCTDPAGNIGTSGIRTFTSTNPQQPAPQPTPGGYTFLTLSYSLTCTNNRITVLSNGVPIANAHVIVWEVKPDGSYSGLYEADTEQAGEVRFPGCGKHIFINATKSGYSTVSTGLELIACGQCSGAVQNQSPTNQTPASSCTLDSDCSLNQVCLNHSCVAQSQPTPTPEPQPTPEPTPVKQLVLQTPASAQVGQVIEAKVVCDNCEVRITDPQNQTKKETLVESAIYKISIKSAGFYKVEIVKDGVVLKSATITATGEPSIFAGLLNNNLLVPAGLGLVLLVVIAVVAYILLKKKPPAKSVPDSKPSV